MSETHALDDLFLTEEEYRQHKKTRRHRIPRRVAPRHPAPVETALTDAKAAAKRFEAEIGVAYKKIWDKLNVAIRNGAAWGIERKDRRPVGWIRDIDAAREYVYDQFNVIVVKEQTRVILLQCAVCGSDLDTEAATYGQRRICDGCSEIGWRFNRDGRLYQAVIVERITP